jgi:hypothetical protein
MAVKMSVMVFWVLTLYGLVGSYQHFGGIFVTTYKTIWHHNPEDMINITSVIHNSLF